MEQAPQNHICRSLTYTSMPSNFALRLILENFDVAELKLGRMAENGRKRTVVFRQSNFYRRAKLLGMDDVYRVEKKKRTPQNLILFDRYKNFMHIT